MDRRRIRFAAGLTAALLTLPSLRGSADARISGVVRLIGPAPARGKLPLTDAACKAMHPGGLRDEAAIVGPDGGIANIFAWVAGGLPGRRWPDPPGPVRIEQRGCRFEPHVFGMRPGQRIEIVNADTVLHNIHALPKHGRGFNAAMPPRETPWSILRTLPAAEVMVKIRCDIHGWMSSWAGVVDHPFFSVTDTDGRYAIDGLPAGTYELRFWHERFGVRTRRVTVTADGRATADVSFEANP